MNDQTPFIGRSMTRREDRRLLTGRGQYIADLELPHMLQGHGFDWLILDLGLGEDACL